MPCAAISMMRQRMWWGRGRPLMKTPPSWFTRPCPAASTQCHYHISQPDGEGEPRMLVKVRPGPRVGRMGLEEGSSTLVVGVDLGDVAAIAGFGLFLATAAMVCGESGGGYWGGPMPSPVSTRPHPAGYRTAPFPFPPSRLSAPFASTPLPVSPFANQEGRGLLTPCVDGFLPLRLVTPLRTQCVVGPGFPYLPTPAPLQGRWEGRGGRGRVGMIGGPAWSDER